MTGFRSWDELSEVEQLQCLYSDMHKDAYGCRPRGAWVDIDADWLRKEIEYLEGVIALVVADERAAEDRAAIQVEERIADLIASGARDRAAAVRWMHEAEGTQGDDEYLCFTLGLAYGYFKKVAA